MQKAEHGPESFQVLQFRLSIAAMSVHFRSCDLFRYDSEPSGTLGLGGGARWCALGRDGKI